MQRNNQNRWDPSHIVAGANAGVVGTVLGFPLDSIKTRMQTTHQSIGNTSRIIFKENGIGGFYRGVAAPLLSLTILNTMNFSLYAYFQQSIHDVIPVPHNAEIWFNWRYGIAAMIVAPFSSTVSTPFELVKTQMQLNINKNPTQKITTVQTLRNILSQHSIRKLYTGHIANTLREVVFLFTYFTVYEHSKLVFCQYFNAGGIPIAGGFSGAIGWFVSFPLDLIKSNIQGVELTQSSNKSVSQVARSLIMKYGIVGLYAGVVPSIVRAFVVSSTRFSAYEGTLYALGKTSER